MFNSCGERGDFVGIGGAGYGSNSGNPLVDMFSQRHGIDQSIVGSVMNAIMGDATQQGGIGNLFSQDSYDRSITTIKEKPLSSKWFESSGIGEGKIDYFHLSIEDYGAPSLEELDYVVNYISRQIDNGRPVMVHCSGGKGRTGTTLAAYLLKKRNVLNAYQAINKLRKIRRESIQSKDQENILFSYEKYLGKRPSTENNTDTK